jgi:protein-disulfide isomerase
MFRRALLMGLLACGESPKHAAAGPAGGSPAAGAEATAPQAVPAPTGSIGQGPPAQAPVPGIVAEIDGLPITWDELWSQAAPQIVEAELALFQARSDALQNLLMQKLIEGEAQKAGTSPEAWVQGQIGPQVTPPTDAEVTAFYEQNRARMQGSLEDMKPQIAQYLEQEKAAKAFRGLLAKLEADHGVHKYLPHYRVEVAAEDSPRKGETTAPIQIVEFSDFQCPYCSDAAAVVRQVQEKYGDKVSVVYRHYPLPMHPQAHRAAQASQCANDQGGFWKFHDSLFAEQKAWTDEDFEKYAKAADIKVKDFKKCMETNTHAATVDEDMEDGRMVGMNGTPGFYINGIVLSGARPIEDFVQVIDAELARLEKDSARSGG